MVAYRVEGSTAEYVYNQLKRQHMIVKLTGYNLVFPGNDIPQESVQNLRFSTHLFNDETQIDQLVDALGRMLGVSTQAGLLSGAASLDHSADMD